MATTYQSVEHELHNSLAPVQTLTEHLQQKLPPGREQDAVALIRERSQHLQDFVSRYAELNKELKIQPQRLYAKELFARLQLLFQHEQLSATGLEQQFMADSMLLQQVLINLIKNACEAQSAAGTVSLSFRLAASQMEICVLDQGHGIQNLQNLFVPFYSTKAQGQGIGLALCRQIIEQMGGNLQLHNRTDGYQGACARILLPQAAA